MNMIDSGTYGLCLMKFDNNEIDAFDEVYNKRFISDFYDESHVICIKLDLVINTSQKFSNNMVLVFCYEYFNMSYEEGLEYLKCLPIISAEIIDNKDSYYLFSNSGWNDKFKCLLDIDQNEELLTYIKLKYQNITGKKIKRTINVD